MTARFTGATQPGAQFLLYFIAVMMLFSPVAIGVIYAYWKKFLALSGVKFRKSLCQVHVSYTEGSTSSDKTVRCGSASSSSRHRQCVLPTSTSGESVAARARAGM